MCAVHVVKKGRNLILFRVHQCFSPPLTSSTVSRMFLSVPPPPNSPSHWPTVSRPEWPVRQGRYQRCPHPRQSSYHKGRGQGHVAHHSRAAHESGTRQGVGRRGGGQHCCTVVNHFLFFLRFFFFFPARDTNTVFWLINRFGYATANKCCCFSFLISLVIVWV